MLDGSPSLHGHQENLVAEAGSRRGGGKREARPVWAPHGQSRRPRRTLCIFERVEEKTETLGIQLEQMNPSIVCAHCQILTVRRKPNVVVTAGGSLYLLRLKDGEKVWSADVSDYLTSPAVVGGKIIVGADDGTITLYGKSR